MIKSKLTAKQIKDLAIKEKRYKVTLGDGFYVDVMSSGEKFYRVKHGLQTVTIGKVSEISLKDALAKAEKEKEILIDPTLAEKTFTQIFEMWSEQKEWAIGTNKKRQSIIKNYLQVFKKRNIKDIKRLEILEIIRKIEVQGKLETAYKALSIMRQVFDYALICGYIEINPTTGLNKALKTQISVPRAALVKEDDVKRLVNAIYSLEDNSVSKLLKFTMFTLCRPSECRLIKWEEVERDIWKIPAWRMKLRKAHIVPLSRQCIDILDSMKEHSLYDYVFPSPVKTKEFHALSENALLVALRKLGFSKEQMSVHGFRSMGSTILNEKGYRHDVIEKALAHAGEDKIRAIYNRAEYLEERRIMMQDYADYIESLLIK